MLERPKAPVLCVDDDHDILRVLRHALETEGFDVGLASGGLAALEWVERHGYPELAIVDIRMPDLSGLELSRQVLESCDLPIILLTAVDDEETVVRAIEGLAEDYVVKPFRPRELMARVKRVLRRFGETSRRRGRVIPLSDGLSVDLVGRRAVLGDREVALTPTETKILSVLMRRLGHTVSNEYLLSRVWPLEEVFEDSLRVHVHRLRRKIEADAGSPHRLLTDRGLGYRLTGL